MPNKAEENVARAERVRDVEMARAFNRAFALSEQLMQLAGIAAAGNRHATISEDMLRKAASLLAFCAGYAAGEARIKAMTTDDIRRLMQ